MQTPRPAYNPTHNQAGQSGQPIYQAQVPAHGARHPAIYSTPGQQHQPNPPGPMNHPTNNVPPAPGPMVPNSQSQPGHPQYPHGPVAPAVRPFISHQQQSGQAQRQMIHSNPGNGPSAIGAAPNFINQSYPMPASIAGYTHTGSHSVMIPASQVSQISHFTQPIMQQQMIPQMYTGRIPYAHGNPMPNFYLNPPYITSTNYPASMVPTQNIQQNQNTVPNPPRAQQAQYTPSPAPNTSGTASAPEMKSRPRIFAKITDPNTGKNLTPDELKESSPSSSQLPTAGESAPTMVPTTDSSSGTSLSKKQPPKPSKVPTSEEPKDSQSQQQKVPTPPLQQPQQQQQQQQQPPQLQTPQQPQQKSQQQQQQPQQQPRQPQQQAPILSQQLQQPQQSQQLQQQKQQQPQQQQQQPQPQSQPPNQPQQQQQQQQIQPPLQPQPQLHRQEQEPQVTSTTESQATVEVVGKESASIVKPDVKKTESTSSDIQPANESVVKPALPRAESAPAVAPEAKPESVIEPLAKPVTISSENETSSSPNDLKSKPAATEPGEIPVVEITKSSSPTEKATPVQVTSSVPAVTEPSGQSTKQTTTTDDVQKKLKELSLNGDISERKDTAVESPTNDSLKSETDSKSLKSQSSTQQQQQPLPPLSHQQEPEQVSQEENKELMQYKDGKYQYSRDQLFQLRSSPCCQEPPKLAQHIWDTLRNNSKPSSNIPRQGHDPFYPFPQGSSSGLPRNLMAGSRGNLYSGRYSLDARTAKKVIPAPPLLQDVKLHTTENAWKPELKKKSAAEVDSDEAKTNELLKTFRGYLNKITPQKYDVIESKIKELTIDSEDRLIKVLNLIFDKAVDEPAFCVQYANLCNYLNTLKVPKVNEKGESEIVGFWRLLLTKCQEQFERDIYADVDVEGKTQVILDCDDVEKRRILEAELEEDKRRARKKSLGNMKLIGELYRLNMLNVKIMISCVQRLLFPIEEENIECLCTLLRTIGAKLEADCKEKQQSVHLDRFFNQLKSIADDIKNRKSEAAKLSSRVRFLILDVLDMRKNSWQERSIQLEDRPKTIQEIHAEVALQEEKQLQESIQYSQNRERRKNHSDTSFARKSQQGADRGASREVIASVLNSLKDTISQTNPTAERLGFSTDYSAKWGRGSGTHTQATNTNRPSQEQKQEPNPKQEADKKSPESGE